MLLHYEWKHITFIYWSLKTAYDSVLFAIGKKDVVVGTGMLSFISFGRDNQEETEEKEEQEAPEAAEEEDASKL